ncbi:EamA family transporter [Aurantibacter crassamenti]|nr:DMT family transporter [Aurantibacter crassamenti]MBM1107437.1 EamA family transporter [Aurantibacter crassamenti]
MLFGSTSGVLGRYIELPVTVTICLRASLAFLLLFLYCKWRKFSFKIFKEDRFLLFVSAVLMGVHFVSYFYALQYSNVAIAMLSLFTYPVITSFLEPLILKTKFQKVHLLLAGMLLCGIYFLVPDFSLENSYSIAVFFGVFSAVCYALRNILMKSKVTRYNGSFLMCYQMGVTGVLLLPALYFIDFDSVISQWKALAALALLTTTIGHTLFLNSFKHFSITTASILSSIQPVYGIILGALFLSEIPALPTVFGGALILASVLIESLRSRK